jgi:putative addiction module component (TIGR02574 family)
MRGLSVAVTMKSFGIDQLSVADRIALVQEIWDSIAATSEEVPLTEAQKQEFDRRLADLETNLDSVLTWQEIKMRVRGQG